MLQVVLEEKMRSRVLSAKQALLGASLVGKLSHFISSKRQINRETLEKSRN